MKGTILEKIVESKRLRVADAKRAIDRGRLREDAEKVHAFHTPHRLRNALSDRTKINIIAEFKKASPSKGLISNSDFPAEIARQYQEGGAAAISVLTEEDHFKGSLSDLAKVRGAVDLPILRKDFIFDPFQVYEAAAAGSDAILLIVAMLSDSQLIDLEALAEDELGMDALIEVHTEEELERIADPGSKLVGVNNRDLHTFNVSLDVSKELIKQAPAGSLWVSESGLSSRDDIVGLKEAGFSGFLIGESLMRSGDPAGELRRLSD